MKHPRLTRRHLRPTQRELVHVGACDPITTHLLEIKITADPDAHFTVPVMCQATDICHHNLADDKQRIVTCPQCVLAVLTANARLTLKNVN